MPKKSRKNVGLIGLGIIGSRVANALRTGGFHVYVWNRTPRAAPNFLASPHQVAELCDVIQLFVADAQALFDVLESMRDALTPSHIILCNATVGPEATLDAARIVQDRGAQFLDAPFTGSKAAAQNRELVYYIGGDDKTLRAAEPVLKASSKAIVKIGKIGDAAVIKIATNMISAVTVQTLAEAYAIVKHSGIDPQTLAEALKQHGVRSGVTDAKLAKMLDRDYEPHFSLKHMFKDVQLGIHIANSLDIDLPATTATAGVMYGGLTRGWSDEDFAVLARSYQKEEPAPLEAPSPAKVEQKAEPAPPVSSGPSLPSAPPVLPAPAASAAPDQAKDALPTQPPAPAAEKKEEPPRELTPDELLNVGIKVPEAPAPEPAPEPLKSDAAPEGAAEAGKAPPETPGENGTPGGADRQHTPFVRIRRWFGTGSAS
jgi:3-hydroxyisobutyrate dehydrogenase-like beta-hydroxyacid dehydrogenase